MNTWGYLHCVNLYDCDSDLIKDQKYISDTLSGLCKVIEMIPHGDPYVDRFGERDLEGVSGVQMIETSSITLHADEGENRVFVDIFSCKKFNYDDAKYYLINRFKAEKATEYTMDRF